MIPTEFQNFKAPGTYLVTEDSSQTAVITPPSGARLLIGNSPKGPVGKPILFAQGDWAGFKATFGDISRAEERKGDFSKRSAFYMLQVSAIYYLNLRTFDDNLDKAGKVSLSTNTKYDNLPVEVVPYRSLFNRNQFWSIDSDAIVPLNNTQQLITIANSGTKPVSFFIRKSKASLTSLTFSEWYANQGKTMPDYVYGNDKVSDWYIDVVVFNNDFSDSAKNTSNTSYGYLFDSIGVRKTVVNELGDQLDGLQQLSNISASGYLTTFTGCLIPGFINESNQGQDIVQIINSAIDKVGLIAAYNTDILDAASIWEASTDNAGAPIYESNGQKKDIPVDIVGHGIVNIAEDGSFDSDLYISETVQVGSYVYVPTSDTIDQSVSTVIDLDVLEPVNSELTIITTAMLPGTETAVGSDYQYSIQNNNDSVIVAFESNKPQLGDKYVGRDGNLATVKSINYKGQKTYLKGFGTYALPVQPADTTDFDSGNDGFISSPVSGLLDILILSDGGYGDWSATVSSVTAPHTIVLNTDVTDRDALSSTVKIGNSYYTINTISTNTITVVEDFTGAEPALSAHVAFVSANATQNSTTLSFNSNGTIRIYNATTHAVTTVNVVNGTLLGFYTGGWQTYSLTDFNYTTHASFNKNSSGVFIYPIGHPLSGQPVVGSSTNSNKPIHNPRTGGTNYVYQKYADGTDAIPSYPTTGYNPGAEEYISVIIGDLSPSELAAIKSTSGYVQNVYFVQLDKSIALNASIGGVGSRLPYTSTGARDLYGSVLVLDDSTELIVYANDNVLFKVKTPEQVVSSYRPMSLISYKPRKEQFVDGTAKRQNAILDMLTNDLRSALKNRDLLSYEYIVDGFKTYIEPSIKSQLSTIAAERVTELAISSHAFMKDFQKSTNPYFRQTIDGQFDPKYIATGGNLSLPYTNTYSLPITGNTNIGFFGNVIINDGGDVFEFPGAALVSNNYAAKYNGGNVYDIVAGKDLGAITGQNVTDIEYYFKPSDITGGGGDLDVLYPWGYNALVRKSGIIQIYGNRTAQNNIETALSLIHVREIVKYLQLQMLQLLDEYVFKYNTAENRLEAKTRADGITGPIVASGALISATNICDTSNNTNEVISAKLFVLDTIIKANNGIEIAVHRTKIDSATNTATFQLL